MNTHTYAYERRETPSSTAGPTEADSDLDTSLAEAEATRQKQLDTLSDTTADLITIAYRDSVKRILGEIRTARRRLHDGLHGVCVDCSGSIAAERIEALAWATQCTACAQRRYR